MCASLIYFYFITFCVEDALLDICVKKGAKKLSFIRKNLWIRIAETRVLINFSSEMCHSVKTTYKTKINVEKSASFV